MSSITSQDAPIYIVKWKLGPNERGRRHMAVFVPNPQCRDIDPSDKSKTCVGTILNVEGSPMMGFRHNIKRNWDQDRPPKPNFFALLSRVNGQNAPDPSTSEYVLADSSANGLLNQLALTVRPPGVSQPLWDAESIFDCQDWVYDYIERLVQKRVVADPAALTRLRALQDPKTALMPAPGSASTSALPLTASVMHGGAIRAAAEPTPPAATMTQFTRGIYTNSEWDAARKAFRRYNRTAEQWEARDSEGNWRPSTEPL